MHETGLGKSLKIVYRRQGLSETEIASSSSLTISAVYGRASSKSSDDKVDHGDVDEEVYAPVSSKTLTSQLLLSLIIADAAKGLLIRRLTSSDCLFLC